MKQGTKQIHENNLKVIKDQIGYETLLSKKYSECAQSFTDTELKNLCNQAYDTHRQNFTELKTYLDSHQ
ncbi:hypothetical protein [Clostridium sp. DL1XJH146]